MTRAARSPRTRSRHVILVGMLLGFLGSMAGPPVGPAVAQDHDIGAWLAAKQRQIASDLLATIGRTQATPCADRGNGCNVDSHCTWSRPIVEAMASDPLLAAWYVPGEESALRQLAPVPAIVCFGDGGAGGRFELLAREYACVEGGGLFDGQLCRRPGNPDTPEDPTDPDEPEDPTEPEEPLEPEPGYACASSAEIASLAALVQRLERHVAPAPGLPPFKDSREVAAEKLVGVTVFLRAVADVAPARGLRILPSGWRQGWRSLADALEEREGLREPALRVLADLADGWRALRHNYRPEMAAEP
jgi:hypothetical protein